MLQSITLRNSLVRPKQSLLLVRYITTTTAKKTASEIHTVEKQVEPKGTILVRLSNEEERKEGAFLTKPVFEHPTFDKEEMKSVKYEHRPVKGLRDWITFHFVKNLRGTFDWFTGYQEIRNEEHRLQIANSADKMTKEKWLARFVVLESVAGIPGSVAGFLRHMRAMRMFRRDMGFIDTLYDEAFNERMHLLTFLKIARPTVWTRIMLWFGQGIFANLFFITYVLSPRTCHRFVGYLEEEAVSTYTRCIEDMERGLCPDLETEPVPQIAKDYWKLNDNATMYDLLQYIRADEAKHREVNHTFANLNIEGTDRNPFALQVGDGPQPNHTLHYHHAKGWERNDIKV
ncbi:hypothetical protein CANINC_003698 [Pichia inconspicua]|uniref:Alternative oxidase n=1 Tax=Pichia inconspicua TaxID=52247 RepID=A0A4T0WY42_9ASCO|nr:hypothetical protein CANINC_003698 [[Candida] inconspicua]